MNIEALTALDMINKDILPTLSKYSLKLAETLKIKNELKLDSTYEKDILDYITTNTKKLYEGKLDLENTLAKKDNMKDIAEISMFYKDEILTRMEKLRDIVDGLETKVDEKVWPYPSYAKLLYSIQ